MASSTTTRKRTKPTFSVERMKDSEVDEVVEFLEKHFFPREPVSTGLHLTKEDTKGWMPRLVSLWQQVGVSSVAREDGTRAMAGVVLVSVLKRDTGPSYHLADQDINNKKVQAVFALVTEVESAVNMYDKFWVEAVMELHYLSVARQYEGYGVGSRLVEETENIGRAMDVRACTAQASNVVSQRLFASRGYTTINRVLYGNFKFEGKKVMDLNNIGASSSIDMMIRVFPRVLFK